MLTRQKNEVIASEAQEHLTFVEWAKLNYLIKDLILHIPNEFDGGAVRGKIRQRMGVRRGVSDFFVPYPTKTYYGLWIEIKRKKNYRVTDDQFNWIERMNDLGYLAMVAYGADEAINITENYLKNSQ